MGNAVGREKMGMVVGVIASEGSAMAAMVFGTIMRKRTRMLMTMGGVFREESIVELGKVGSFGEFECRCMRLTAHGGIERLTPRGALVGDRIVGPPDLMFV